MRTQVVKIDAAHLTGGMKFLVTFDTKETSNPYRIYEVWWEPGRGERRKQIARYADLVSCLYYLADRTRDLIG